ncbi:ketopantoate reductase family protein [Bacterioplanes sanyensis]|uniref:ketopantoate reductase family protein n=1 Tax=Bacterioplanes sanyensis TaxID=1249553 RepID=UPI00167805ED|nr:ketopantoate reductase family protein [Bacterioplanes sanyensis]
MMTIAILGAGAIGTLMAYHWRQLHPMIAGADQPVMRQLQHQRSTSLTLPAWQGHELDWLVVCTKASATLPALQPLAPHLANVKHIALLQNGMGQQHALQQWLDQQPKAPQLWVASTTEGAYRRSPSEVVYAGQGDTVIGPWRSTSEPWPPLPPRWQGVEDIQQRLFHKLAINAVINPLTALHRCRNGKLLTPAHRPQLLALCGEVSATFAALQWPQPAELTATVIKVAEATAYNQSSTLQDLLANRPTELDYITGFILSQAQQNSVSTPLQQALAQQLKLKLKLKPSIDPPAPGR